MRLLLFLTLTVWSLVPAPARVQPKAPAVKSNATPATLRAAAVQMRSSRDLADNITRIRRTLKELAADGVRVAVFPECALTGYFDKDFFEQLTAERLVTRYVKGHPKLEWVKPPGKRNEALDCAVYALAAAHMVGIDRWRELDWAKWERHVQALDLFDAGPPPPATAAPASDAQPEARPEPASPPLPAADEPLAMPRRTHMEQLIAARRKANRDR